jgi:hypothetical protein
LGTGDGPARVSSLAGVPWRASRDNSGEDTHAVTIVRAADAGRFYAVVRHRAPRTDQRRDLAERGHTVQIRASDDGVRFAPIWSMTKTERRPAARSPWSGSRSTKAATARCD